MRAANPAMSRCYCVATQFSFPRFSSIGKANIGRKHCPNDSYQRAWLSVRPPVCKAATVCPLQRLNGLPSCLTLVWSLLAYLFLLVADKLTLTGITSVNTNVKGCTEIYLRSGVSVHNPIASINQSRCSTRLVKISWSVNPPALGWKTTCSNGVM